jgi:hypothetical protein
MTLSRIAAAVLLVITASACESSPAQVSVSPSDAIALLDCQAVIGSEAVPAAGDSTVLDRVALPTKQALQANRTGDPGTRRFAKDGLYVRRDVSFDLIVQGEWRDRLSINWGFPGEATHHLRVPGCRPTRTINPIREQDAWLIYSGGYTVSEPACVALVVKAAEAEQTVRIGVGASCQGQGPPPPPV